MSTSTCNFCDATAYTTTTTMAPDQRFARLTTDPRFRRAKQKNVKAEIDERFKDVLTEDFGKVQGACT